MPPVIWLLLAIGTEVVATSALKASDGFSRLFPSIVVVAGYAASFYFLSLSLRDIPLGVVYAVWSGIGTAAIALIGIVFFHETLGWVGVGGIVLIVPGRRAPERLRRPQLGWRASYNSAHAYVTPSMTINEPFWGTLVPGSQ